MEALKIGDILEATGGRLVCGNQDDTILDIVTDSRSSSKGVFFIPLKGENFDGHDFIDKAFALGAVGCITEKELDYRKEEKNIIKVENTLTAFHDIARYYRNRFSLSFIAVTGSVGKTSTKDMLACVLGEKLNVLKTEGNFNNEIGLPLTVLRLGREHDIAITEMGMSGFGEISRLSSIVKPNYAVITNIGLSHIEKLGSQENILKAKMEVFETFDGTGVAILNGDDPMLFPLKDTLPFKTIFFGIHNIENDLSAYDISESETGATSFNINIEGDKYTFEIPTVGEHNIYNALAAIAIGLECGMDIKNIEQGLSKFKSSKMRMDIFESKGIKVIDDCYNASPSSMEAALKVLSRLNCNGRKIAILGDMLEMGEWAYDAHKKVGVELSRLKIDYLVTVGYNGKSIALGALESGMQNQRIYSFDANDEVIEFISGFLKDGDAVLIKASRGMKFEVISEYIREVR